MGQRTLVVAADARQSIRWRSHRVTGDQIMLFPRGAALDAISEVGFHVYTISFALEHMTAIADVLVKQDYAGLLAGRDLTQCEHGPIEELRIAAQLVARRADEGGGPDELLE